MEATRVRLNEGRAVALHCAYCGDPVWDNNGHLCTKCRDFDEAMRREAAKRASSERQSEDQRSLALVRDALRDCPLSPGLKMSIAEMYHMLQNGSLTPGSLVHWVEKPKRIFKVRETPRPRKQLHRGMRHDIFRPEEIARWLDRAEAEDRDD
jgi:hypothetical protein